MAKDLLYKNVIIVSLNKNNYNKMNYRVPTCFHRREGYGVDSIQKRLAEIVYLDSKPQEMQSRKGKFLEFNRDKTQMLGVA